MRALVLLIALLAVPVGAAQTAHIRVDADDGEVWVDGERVGDASRWVGVEAGERDIVLVEDSRAWDPRRASTSLTLAAGDSATVTLTLPTRLRVESLPIRADVRRETADGVDSLGTAPLTLDVQEAEAVVLVASLDGYEAVRQVVEPGADRVTLVLPLAEDTVPEAALLPTERSTLRRTLLDVGIATATVAAGALAVHYKFRADATDDRYRTETSADFGVESVRQEVLRLDRASGIALGAMQAGIGVLALRFVLR